jgi:hypothetical protein
MKPFIILSSNRFMKFVSPLWGAASFHHDASDRDSPVFANRNVVGSS